MFVNRCQLEVRYYETDQMGIVHHSNYVRYFECGRNASMIEVGLPMNKLEEYGIMMPVVSVGVKYKVPARFGDTLTIVSKIAQEPKVRIVVETEIYNQNDELVCSGEVILGFIHSDTRRVTRAPQPFVDAFKPYFE